LGQERQLDLAFLNSFGEGGFELFRHRGVLG
jgi:hypothetical protein